MYSSRKGKRKRTRSISTIESAVCRLGEGTPAVAEEKKGERGMWMDFFLKRGRAGAGAGAGIVVWLLKIAGKIVRYV